MPRIYAEQMRAIANRYFAYHAGTASTREIAHWAIENDPWYPQPSYLVTRCAEDLADAMRDEHIKDPQGRSVRAKRTPRVKRDGKQMMLWDDIRTATKEHMRSAFQLRRQQIVGDCRQLKADVDSYKENRNPRVPIQAIFDFTLDLEELGDANQPTPPKPTSSKPRSRPSFPTAPGPFSWPSHSTTREPVSQP